MLNVLDAGGEAILQLASTKDAAILMPWWFFLSNQYLRQYLSAHIRQESVTAAVSSGNAAKAIQEIQARQRDPKLRLSHGEAEQQLKAVIQMAKANFYTEAVARQRRNNSGPKPDKPRRNKPNKPGASPATQPSSSGSRGSGAAAPSAGNNN